jgi:hypothetical protein
VGVPFSAKVPFSAALFCPLTLTQGTAVLASLDLATATPNSSGYYPLILGAGLSAGSHTLKVVYSGDALYNAVTMNVATVTSRVPA